MQFAFFALFAAGIVAADQFTKFLTLANIGLGEKIAFIPGLIRFTYVRNYGAAFSSFQGQQWLFALIFAVFTGLMLWEYYKKSMPFSKFSSTIDASYTGKSQRCTDSGASLKNAGTRLRYICSAINGV